MERVFICCRLEKKVTGSVAEPDPGSGTFFHTGIRDGQKIKIRIRDGKIWIRDGKISDLV
jgi:hypothetical protein